jgi:hypothetical protein
MMVAGGASKDRGWWLNVQCAWWDHDGGWWWNMVDGYGETQLIHELMANANQLTWL